MLNHKNLLAEPDDRKPRALRSSSLFHFVSLLWQIVPQQLEKRARTLVSGKKLVCKQKVKGKVYFFLTDNPSTSVNIRHRTRIRLSDDEVMLKVFVIVTILFVCALFITITFWIVIFEILNTSSIGLGYSVGCGQWFNNLKI